MVQKTLFGDHKPANVIVGIAMMSPGYLIEVDAIAVIGPLDPPEHYIALHTIAARSALIKCAQPAVSAERLRIPYCPRTTSPEGTSHEIISSFYSSDRRGNCSIRRLGKCVR